MKSEFVDATGIMVQNFDDIKRIAFEFIKQFPFNKHNQLCLLNTPDHDRDDPYQGIGNRYATGYPMSGLNEDDFTVMHSMIKGTALEAVRHLLPVTRMRLMQIPPKRCYSMHIDGPGEYRVHLALKTNEYAYIAYAENNQLIHIPADGQLYVINADKRHSAVNFDPNNIRTHLVMNLKIS